MVTRTLVALLAVSLVAIATPTSAQTPEPLPQPESAKSTLSGPYADGRVIKAVGSGTVASRILQKASFQVPAKDQIQFEVQIVRLDPETRKELYEKLDPKSIQTEITQVREGNEVDVPGEADSNSSVFQTTSGSIVSTSIIGDGKLSELLTLVKERENCGVIARPKMIAGEGQVAAIQQKVQRPFLSQVEEVEVEDETGVRSDIQVLSEGVDVAVKADIEGDSLKVNTQFRQAKVVKVDQMMVFGVGKGEKIVQVPSHEVRLVSTEETLKDGQTLLIDPYFEETRYVASSTEVPVLDQVPYVGRMFRSTDIIEQKSNVLVLLTAKKLTR